MSQRKYGAAKTAYVFSLPDIWHGYGRSPRCRGHPAQVQPVTNATPTIQPTHTAQRHYNAATPPISQSTTLGVLSVRIAFKSSDLSRSVRTKLVSVMNKAQHSESEFTKFHFHCVYRCATGLLTFVSRYTDMATGWTTGEPTSTSSRGRTSCSSPQRLAPVCLRGPPSLYPMCTAGKAGVTWR
jgi:hypothetical protein